MFTYLELLDRLLSAGNPKGDRTGTGTVSLLGPQMRFDLTRGFPLLTTKRVFLRGVVEELLWMLRGETNVRSLQAKGVKIWDAWADENGDLGPVYGAQWRAWDAGYDREDDEHKTVDQIADVLHQIRTNPDSRRIMVSAWNPADVPKMKLPPCHCLFQFYTRPLSLLQRLRWLQDRRLGDGIPPWADEAGAGIELGTMDWQAAVSAETPDRMAWADGQGAPRCYLDLQLYQRSADVFLGVPFNIASYALLCTLIAREVGMVPGEFVWTGGDVHLYRNHFDQAREQLGRAPRDLPRLRVRDGAPGLFELSYGDLILEGYDPHPAIAAPVAV